MKKLLILLAGVLFCSSVLSGDWISPIDKKYLAKSPELFSKFNEARDIMNSWRGQRVKLKRMDSLLREILSQDKEFAPAYREYGRLYIAAGYTNNSNFREGSLNPAEASILEAIKLEPEYADAYVLLGHLYTNMKRYDDAVVALEKAEAIGTQSPWLDLNWAELLNRKEDYDSAYTRYMNVITEGTSNRKAYTSALSGVTTYFVNKKNYDKADEWFQKQLEYEPETAWIWGNYASFLLYKRNDVDGAILNAEKALSIMNYGTGRFVLACAIYTKWAKQVTSSNNDKEAKALFSKAVAIYPNIDRVIQETAKFKSTRITSKILLEYKRNKELTNTSTGRT